VEQPDDDFRTPAVNSRDFGGADMTDAAPIGATEPAENTYHLRLYVAGQSPKSMRAIENLRRVCEEHLAGRCRVEVIDLLEHPQLARGDEIIAVPTLVRKSPPPARSIIGDLTNAEQVLAGLQLRSESTRQR
jgi:circadian clock protein KaiB